MALWHRFMASILDKRYVEYKKCKFSMVIAGGFRSFTADYGVPFMIVLWTFLSYAIPRKVPPGVPRRLFSPLPWDAGSLCHWSIARVRFLKVIDCINQKHISSMTSHIYSHDSSNCLTNID